MAITFICTVVLSSKSKLTHRSQKWFWTKLRLIVLYIYIYIYIEYKIYLHFCNIFWYGKLLRNSKNEYSNKMQFPIYRLNYFKLLGFFYYMKNAYKKNNNITTVNLIYSMHILKSANSIWAINNKIAVGSHLI